MTEKNRILWENKIATAGRINQARSVAVNGKTVVVAGLVTVENGTDFTVRAYDAKTGAELWSDRAAASPGVLTHVFVTAAGPTVYAAGYVSKGNGSSILVRAYDARTGTVQWQDELSKGHDDLPQAITAGLEAVVVAGYGNNTAQRGPDFLVRAYHPASGAIFWDDVWDSGSDDAAWAAASTRTRVVVAGTAATESGRDMILREYAARSGAVKWNVRLAGHSPVSMIVQSGRVFVGGTEKSNGFVCALRAKTGEVLWEDKQPDAGFVALASGHGKIYAAGRAGQGLILRAYDGKSGALQWQDQTVPESGFNERALCLHISREGIYVGGAASKEREYSELLVRAYNLSGTLIWEDRAHRGAGSQAVSVAVRKRRLFVAGQAGADFVVRAYKLAPLA